MKNWKRMLALLSSLALTASLCACGGDAGASASPSPDASAGDSAAPSAGVDATPAIDVDLTQNPLVFSAGIAPTEQLLTVNGEAVPADLFLYILAMNCSQASMYASLMGTTLEEMAPTLLDDSVTVAATQVLLRQKAAELGCLPTDAQQEEIAARMAESDGDLTSRYYGLTPESVEFLVSGNTYYDNLLDAATHQPSEEELAGYIADLGVYRVKHILLKTVDDSQQPLPEEQVTEKRAQAEDLLAQLQAAEDLPAKFDELMMAHSEDNPQNNPEGYLGASVENAGNAMKMVPEFEEASLALEIGGLSGIVESSFGYHIILRLPLTDEDTAQFKDSFRADALDGQMEQWQEEADIVRADALSGLDAADFFARLSAYQQALQAQEAPAETDPVDPPVESGGAG